MKTAMQEALDNLSKIKIKNSDEMELLGRVASILFMQLEKERIDIMMAFNDGKTNAVLNKINSEQYYNQIYNQNK
jgi:hypothetical protein